MRVVSPAATALLLLSVVIEPAVARAEVVSRILDESVEFAERFGPSERAETAADARLQLYAETAEECRRLEKMSGLACRVESLTLHPDTQAGRTAVLGRVRFALESPADKATGTTAHEVVRPQDKPRDQR